LCSEGTRQAPGSAERAAPAVLGSACSGIGLYSPRFAPQWCCRVWS